MVARLTRWRLGALAALLSVAVWGGAPVAAVGQDDLVPVVPGVVRSMVTIPFDAGAKGTYDLEAMLVTPARRGSYPLAVISHGSPRSAEDRPNATPTSSTAIAVSFARRGWATLVLMRRGYGESEGPWSEGFGTCGDPRYEAAGRASADDLRQAVRYAAGHSSELVSASGVAIDASRVLLVGVSAGGFASVAANTSSLPGLAGVINFAGGRGSQESDEVCGEARLVSAFAAYGRTAVAPTLWVYAENDHFFGPDLARRMFNAWRNAGGRGEFIAAPAFGSDGHGLFSEPGMPIWADYVDRFLRANRLPTWAAPVQPAAPSLAPPAGLSAAGRADFARYLASENFNKAFAVGDRGAYGWRSGRRTPDDAVEAATESCEAHGARCRIYAIDNRLAR